MVFCKTCSSPAGECRDLSIAASLHQHCFAQLESVWQHEKVYILRCLCSSSGVGLRTLYLPGLQGLKEELRMMDWLMERLMPELKQHLDVSVPCCLLCMLPAVHTALYSRCLALLMHPCTLMLRLEFYLGICSSNWLQPVYLFLACLRIHTTSGTNIMDTLHDLEPCVMLFPSPAVCFFASVLRQSENTLG